MKEFYANGPRIVPVVKFMALHFLLVLSSLSSPVGSVPAVEVSVRKNVMAPDWFYLVDALNFIELLFESELGLAQHLGGRLKSLPLILNLLLLGPKPLPDLLKSLPLEPKLGFLGLDSLDHGLKSSLQKLKMHRLESILAFSTSFLQS